MKVVLDTSVVLSALVFSKGKSSWMRDLWKQGKIVPLVCTATANELMRALAYPKFRLDEADLELFLSDFLSYAKAIDLKSGSKELPSCRDINDQMFLELVFQGCAKHLVTSDKDLLVLAGKVPFDILTPIQFKKIPV